MTLKKLVLITAGAMLLSGTAMAKNINVPGDFAKIADALGNADAGDTMNHHLIYKVSCVYVGEKKDVRITYDLTVKSACLMLGCLRIDSKIH